VFVMNVRAMLGASLAAALLVSGALAEDSLRSGPQVGRIVHPFDPLHINGPGKGGKSCLV
jgi:hypothetical protein